MPPRPGREAPARLAARTPWPSRGRRDHTESDPPWPSGTPRSSAAMSQLVVHGLETEPALLAALKVLEIQKTLGDEPVLAALRRFPAQAARHADFPADL